MRRAASLVLATSLALAGCGGGSAVARVVDGRAIAGRYVEAEAYGAYLRGALADGRGDAREALAAYEEAARQDGDEPEIWTRIAQVRCRGAAGDPRAREALEKALALDAQYAPALLVRAECALGARDAAGATQAAAQASAADPRALEARALLARGLEAKGDAAGARAVLVALTSEHGHRVAAWEALGSWADARKDGALAARAWAEIARLAPQRRAEAGARATALAGEGLLGAARALAGAAVDAGAQGGGRAVEADAVRLAVDDAIAAGDVERAMARATRGRLPLTELAGRAWALGAPALARDVARLVADADPDDAAARMVLALAAARAGEAAELARSLRDARRGAAPVPAAVALPFARRLAELAGAEPARAFVDGLAADAPSGADVVVVPIAVDLAALGVLRDEALPPSARVELCARRREPVRGVALDALDARHRLVATALAEPASEDAIAQARRLGAAVGRDPLVTFAVTRIAMARGGADVEPAKLLAAGPTDPLILSVAVDVAKKKGDAEALGRARARLTAVAKTPAERERVRE